MDSDILLTAVFVVVLVMAAGYLGLSTYAGARERRLRLKARMAGGVSDPGESAGGGAVSQIRAWILSLASKVGESVKPKKAEEISKLRTRLIRAGLRRDNAVAVFWGIKVGLILIGLAVAVLISLALPESEARQQHVLLVYLTFPSLFAMAPGYWLDKRVEGRKKAVQNGLPDALDLLVVCVEAGMGMDQAIHRVSMELKSTCPVLSEEFRLLTLELRAGKARREGLKNLAFRIGVDDVNSLVALLIQADIFGTSVATTLRVYSDAMRTKRFQKAEEIAAKLPVKMLMPLIFFILPPLFIVIMGPGAIRLMQILSKVN